jgi:hypothetical protein
MSKKQAPSSTKSANPKHVTYVKNRERKLEKHLKLFPNDKVAETCYASGAFSSYRRRTPKTKVWSKQDIAAVKLYKAAGLSGKRYLSDKMKLKKGFAAAKIGTPSA